MPIIPRKQGSFVSSSRPSAPRLQFMVNTCESMTLELEDEDCITQIYGKDAVRPADNKGESSSYSSSSSSSSSTSATYMPCSTENHCCALLHGLQELRKTKTFCDYTLIAEDQEIPVHRAVMAACSDYFKVMLTGNMRESREECVKLKGVTAGGLSVVVDFAYTGRLKLTTDNVEDVLSAASHLQVSVAVELCSKYLEMALTTYNCTDIFNLAQMYSLAPTQAKARQFILDNFEIFSSSDQYKKLRHTQLAGMLEENSLRVPSEYHLFKIVLQWIEHDKDDRLQYLAQLIRNIRLPLLAGEELVEKVSKIEMMRSNMECSNLLTEAKDYHIVIGKQPLLQTPRTQVRSTHPSIVMLHSQNLECYTFVSKHHGYLKDSLIPLFNPSIAVFDNFMYALGGKYDSTENNEIATARCFRYDPRFDSWFELPSMNEARKDFVVIAHQGKLYAIGGQDENMVMCTVECYNVSREDWEMCTSMSHSCYGHAGASCGDKIYVSGGQRFSGCSTSTICYNPVTDIWEDKANMLYGRCNHSMAEVRGKLYVIGGNIEDSYGFPVPIITLESYNCDTNQWTTCQTNCNIREAGATVLNMKIYIVGGINGEHYYSDLLQEYDPSTDKMVHLDRFSTRIYGRACCILTLPHYLSGIGTG